VADACRRAEDSSDGLDNTLAGLRISKTRKVIAGNGRTERVWAYPSACSTGIERLRFEFSAQGRGEWMLRPHQVDALPSDSWPPPRSGDVARERERDPNWNRPGALAAGAPTGRYTLPSAVDCGAAGADATRAIGMTDCVALAASRAGDRSRAPNERWRPRAAVGGGVWRREAHEGGVRDWEWW
jgi:hypothetical protein